MREPVRYRFHGDHVEAVLALGDIERAETLVGRLEERARALPRPWLLAVSTRCRGLVLAARGDPRGGPRLARGRLAHHEKLDFPYELARTLLAQAHAYRRHKKKRLAREAAQRALALFEECGATLWAERTRAELARLRFRASPTDLTETEHRVAELAAAGRTNREIAAELYVSPKTVETRLASVYRKLDMRSRAQLGARLAELERELSPTP
jgi:DNA-binding CsgD family transcriptional regulator